MKWLIWKHSMIEFIEYSLSLNTGETIEVSEISDKLYPPLSDPEVQEICKPILDKCVHVSHFILEEAKLGFSKQLDEKLSTPPLGALIKLALICSEIDICAIADKIKCNTNYRKKMGKDTIYCPSCWDFKITGDYAPTSMASAKLLVTSIISAWKFDHYVIVVDENGN